MSTRRFCLYTRAVFSCQRETDWRRGSATHTRGKLTNTQIDVLCDGDFVRFNLVTKQQVATLLRRARAANDIYDSSGIPPDFILQ